MKISTVTWRHPALSQQIAETLQRQRMSTLSCAARIRKLLCSTINKQTKASTVGPPAPEQVSKPGTGSSTPSSSVSSCGRGLLREAANERGWEPGEPSVASRGSSASPCSLPPDMRSVKHAYHNALRRRLLPRAARDPWRACLLTGLRAYAVNNDSTARSVGILTAAPAGLSSPKQTPPRCRD